MMDLIILLIFPVLTIFFIVFGFLKLKKQKKLAYISFVIALCFIILSSLIVYGAFFKPWGVDTKPIDCSTKNGICRDSCESGEAQLDFGANPLCKELRSDSSKVFKTCCVPVKVTQTNKS